MKKMFAIALMAISIPAMAGRVEVRQDVMRLMECSIYHRIVYPLYVKGYVNASGLMYHKHDMGVLNLDTPTWKRYLNNSAQKFVGMDVDTQGSSLMRCQVFSSSLIQTHNLVEYAKQVQAAAASGK